MPLTTNDSKPNNLASVINVFPTFQYPSCTSGYQIIKVIQYTCFVKKGLVCPCWHCGIANYLTQIVNSISSTLDPSWKCSQVNHHSCAIQKRMQCTTSWISMRSSNHLP